MTTPPRIQWSTVVAVLPLGLAWALLLDHLSIPWTLSPNYRFGWFVPLLALYFLQRRWATDDRTSAGGNSGALTTAIGCAFLLAPVWWVRVAAPDWSLVGYTLALLVTGWTFCLFAWLGGWPFARRLAFPIFLIFSALPWPQRAETVIIQSLARWVAFMTVEMLQWTGVAAERAGNLITLSRGTIEVSEACSGVRSLQSMLMVSLCLGEVRQLSVGRRVALVAVGSVVALAFNVCRNYFLSLIAYWQGLEAIARWHDPAGWSILVLSVLLLILLSRWLMPGSTQKPGDEDLASPRLRKLPWTMSAGFALWFAFTALGTEGWYRWHERGAARPSQIEVAWPAERTDFHFQKIPDEALGVLLASEARAASWQESPDCRWTLAALRWAPGETSTQSARVHFPDDCLPAVGHTFVPDLPAAALRVRGGELHFRVSEFAGRERRFYVFFCLREEANRDQESDALRQDWSDWSRIQRAFAGQRNLGQQSLTVAITGVDDSAEALRQLTTRLPELVALVPSASD